MVCILVQRYAFIGRLNSSLEDLSDSSRVVVNSKYAATARAYLEDFAEQTGKKVKDVYELSGKLENEIPENADFGIEIVLSGNTLKYVDKKAHVRRNPELTVLKEIRQSDLSLITSWHAASESDVLTEQYARLQERLVNPTDSLSSRLLQDRNKLIKKFGEETAELIAGYAQRDRANVLEEAQQVLWLLQAMLVSRRIRWEELKKEVQRKL